MVSPAGPCFTMTRRGSSDICQYRNFCRRASLVRTRAHTRSLLSRAQDHASPSILTSDNVCLSTLRTQAVMRCLAVLTAVGSPWRLVTGQSGERDAVPGHCGVHGQASAPCSRCLASPGLHSFGRVNPRRRGCCFTGDRAGVSEMTAPKSLIAFPRRTTMASLAGVGRIMATTTANARARASSVSGTTAAARDMTPVRTFIGSADQTPGPGCSRGAVAV
jgi:hypothetical protein